MTEASCTEAGLTASRDGVGNICDQQGGYREGLYGEQNKQASHGAILTGVKPPRHCWTLAALGRIF